MLDFAKSFLIHITQPRPRYGWTPATRRFKVGSRVRYAIPNVRRYTGIGRQITMTGDTGTIVSGDGKPSQAFNSKGFPIWEVEWDNGDRERYFEWALELV